MFTKILNLWKSEGYEDINTPRGVTIVFELSYKDISMGHLSLENETWRFSYSDVFKNQQNLLPLVDFPDKNEIYISKQLWPFFLSRIPGLGQPKVQKIIKSKQINEHDEVSLLKLFGKRTIANPYILEPAF